MVELRWLEQETGKRLINEFGFFYPETTKTLQYRQQVNTTMYSQIMEPGSGGFVECSAWSEWRDVPTVMASSNDSR